MTQQQQISLLTSIMPEINETHDPKGVMLKCAKKHNLSPAQLEKLGHVYNTAKTLVGLEKQAHRGDSFTIVDVPEMVASYTTFDPAKEVAKDSKGVHRTANRLMKYAEATDGEPGYWTRQFMAISQPQEKSAAVKFPSILDDIFEKNKRFHFTDEADGNQYEEIKLPGGANLNTLLKSAAASAQYVSNQLEKAAEEAREAMYGASERSRDLVREIKEKLIKSGMKDDTWKEMVYDMDDYFNDRVKSASVSHYIESHLDYDYNCKVRPVDLEKRAGVRTLARDRHGIFDKVDEIVECSDVFKEAKALYEALKETEVDKEPATYEKVAELTAMMKRGADGDNKKKGADEFANRAIDATSDAMNSMSDSILNGGKRRVDAAQDAVDVANAFGVKTEKELRKVKENATEQARTVAALQQLMLTDPVIASADPYQVEDIYNTISSLNSTIARDPNLLGPILKESLQYGSIPLQTLKDIVSVDKDRQQADKYRLEAAALKN